MLRRTLAPVLALLAGCGSSSGVPPIDPAVYLRVGSDLATEAPRAEAALREGGYVIDARVEGETFVAFAAHHAEEARTHVRIVSASGVDFGLTAPDRTRSGLREVGLVEDGATGHDLDGDGYEEVLVRVLEADRAAPCLGVVRVGQGGQMREVPLATLRLHPRACVEEVGPGLDDARQWLWAVVRYDELGFGGEAPTVRVPLLPRDASFVPPGPGEASAHFEAEEAVRRERVDAARSAGSGAEVLRLAIELAALERFAGEPTEAQLAAFDGALEGLSLDEGLRERRGRARRFIELGWDPGEAEATLLDAEIIEPDVPVDAAVDAAADAP